MVIACWSVKGGSGTSVVAAGLALLLAESHPDGALLVDLAGDAPALLGLPEPAGPGVGDWLTAPHPVEPEGLLRLAVDATPALGVVPLGEPGPWPAARVTALARALAGLPGPVVVDVGVVAGTAPTVPVVEAATRSLLVVRPCYLALRRLSVAGLRPDAIVLVQEPGRALGRHDVEAVAGVPVHAEVPLDPLVARAVDAGLLASRLPRGLARALRRAA